MIKLPKQLYVVHHAISGDEILLGFLNAYEPNKVAFLKKQQTQHAWGFYNCECIQEPTLEERNGEFWINGFEWEYDRSKQYGERGFAIKIPAHKLLKNPPLIWDNDPLSGFKVAESVSRYFTSNKLWRILDPCNVEFEITTAGLEQLIQEATILKGGIIDAKCAWAGNKKLVVE